MFNVFVFEEHGDHNFEYTVEDNPKEFVNGIRQSGGYFILDREQNLVFIPWHQIHYIRFEEVKDVVSAQENQLPTH